ncbi:MAG: XRE family transcriptional regulator [Anaerovorax sp.]|nr:XRE family transcriptional regulator [Anaerovorax sp.]
MQFNIGNKVKSLRKQKKMSILQLSEKSNVSTGLISQIERELVVPSVVSIWRIAQALDTNISYFFDDEKKNDRVIIRKDDHKKIIMNKGNAIYQLLSPDNSDHLIDFVKITLNGGQIYEKEYLTHEGEECGFVLSGTLTVQLNGEDYVLHEGDSIYFNSNLPHKYVNFEEEDCISIWAMTPLFF